VTAVGGNPGDEETPPAWILAEREQRSDTVIGGAKGCEQLASVGRSRRHAPILAS
jgi:hypothetical protein